MKKALSIIHSLALAAIIVAPRSARAESDVVCAAVFPCGAEGEVVAPFDAGPCAEQYRRQCAEVQMSWMENEMSRLAREKEGLANENRKLRIKINKLQRRQRAR